MPEHSSRNFTFLMLAVLFLGVALHHHHKFRTTPVRSRLISRATYPETGAPHHLFGDLAAVVDIFHIDMTAQGTTEKVVAGAVTANFFRTIGVEPVMGRVFLSGENSRDHVAILSYRLWQRRFNSASGIVGRSITLEGEPFQVIGILPRDFTWNNRATDVWVPCTADSGADAASYISQVRLGLRRSELEFEPEI